jgi:hypothetical protein
VAYVRDVYGGRNSKIDNGTHAWKAEGRNLEKRVVIRHVMESLEWNGMEWKVVGKP